jgi:hypothetical protein
MAARRCSGGKEEEEEDSASVEEPEARDGSFQGGSRGCSSPLM